MTFNDKMTNYLIFVTFKQIFLIHKTIKSLLYKQSNRFSMFLFLNEKRRFCNIHCNNP